MFLSKFQEGIVVQIGLADTCEYHYLSYSDWRSRMQKQNRLKHIPPAIACDRFRYIGIDSDPDSIERCSKKYHENSPTFINQAILSPKQLQGILLEHGVDRIDVLAVDVEGYEKLIFPQNWHHDLMNPRYIAVEIHLQYFPKVEPLTLEEFRLNFKKAGYSLRIEQETNTLVKSWLGSTTEQQWIKSLNHKRNIQSSFTAIPDVKEEGSVINPFFDLPNKNPLTCHIFCLPNAPSNAYYTLSHFAQKIRNLCWMLKSTGNKVIYYGFESCDVVCDEKVIVLPEELLWEAYPKCRDEFGHIDINLERENPEGIEYLEQRWTHEVGYQVQKRYAPNDFLFWMLPMCGQQMLYNQLAHLPVQHVEPGIGYIGALLPYKVFQSAYIRDFHYGSYHSNDLWREVLGPNSSHINHDERHYLYTYINWETSPQHDAVIPNSYDLSLFDFRINKEDYLLLLARFLNGKGVKEAVEISERTGMKLIAAGPGNFELALGKKIPPNVEVLGTVGVEERRELLSRARAVLSLSGVHETFGGVAIEGLISGTVPVVSNTGGFRDTIRHGYNGFSIEYDDVEAGVQAVENLHKIDPHVLRDSGLRFSREQCALKHNLYLQNINKSLRGLDKLSFGDLYDETRKIDWPKNWMVPVDKKENSDV